MKPPPPRAWIMQPPDWQTSLNRIPPSERGLSLCKNNCREPRSILMNSADELPISMGNYCEQYTRASSGV
ncbi:TPA: lysis system o-spanin lipoprotein Rz1 [Escherichia coli]|uniref:lysis system o-spanin lipoprotein Rz1 n=1 Tax=Escherichia coli TaxID=562 RepID=UPI0028938084|nr:lysis system o-spanin lipoprotein Rz1 [Escherichia coli]